MAAVGTQMMNLLEWSRFYHKGKVLPVINMLAQWNQAVMDLQMRPCNDGTTHLYRIKTALPTVHKTMFGEGTPESKSQSAEERETPTMLTGFSTVEKEMTRIGGGGGMIRAREDMDFAEALRQLHAQMLFYANRNSNIRDFYGISTRLNSLSGVKASQVVSCGGASANAQTSVYFINHGPDVYGIFPEGTTGGYAKENLGTQVKTLTSGNQLVVEQTFHKWHVGLVVESWKSIARICNIEVAHLLALSNNQTATSALNVLNAFLRVKNEIRRPGKLVAYANDAVHAWLMRVGMDKSSSAVKVQEAASQFGGTDGKIQELMVFDVPVRKVDQILTTEPVVS